MAFGGLAQAIRKWQSEKAAASAPAPAPVGTDLESLEGRAAQLRSWIAAYEGDPNNYLDGVLFGKAASEVARLQEEENKINRQIQRTEIKAARQEEIGQAETARQKFLAERKAFEPELAERLLGQQKLAFERIRPLIEQQLAARGILQSGALPEAFGKQAGLLELERQRQLGEFATQTAGAGAELSLLPFQVEQQFRRAGLQQESALREAMRQQLAQRSMLSQGQMFQRAQAGEINRRRRAQALAGLIGAGFGAGVGSFGGLKGAEFGSQFGGAFGGGVAELF